MARKIEMHWVCTSCQTRNLGRHKVCVTCGDPKDASERWLMPEDPGAAPSVTDPALLRQASAGVDWQCGYCGSHQKRSDGACAQCGAAEDAGARVPKGGASASAARWGGAQHGSASVPTGGVSAKGARWGGSAAARPGATGVLATAWKLLAAAAAVLALTCGCCVVAGAFHRPGPEPPDKPESARARVAALSWRRVVHVERYQLVSEEGFLETRPADALEVASLGQAHHHDEQVLDHYETEHYTESVPYQDNETYTAQEACGEDCTTLPETCREECSPDDNGFATCHDVCTGGGQSCTTRYCSVTRTRTVTRHREEPRTREVPRYRAEPRYAERFRWRAWRWRHARDIDATGSGSTPLRWPDDRELAPPASLAEGERERTTRETSYEARLDVEGRSMEMPVSDEPAFRRLQAISEWHVDDGEEPPRLIKPVPRFDAR